MKKKGSKHNILVSDFRKIFARQISKAQKFAKTCKLMHNVRSMTTSTFEYKFVLRIGFIVRVTVGCSVLV